MSNVMRLIYTDSDINLLIEEARLRVVVLNCDRKLVVRAIDACKKSSLEYLQNRLFRIDKDVDSLEQVVKELLIVKAR